MLPTVCVVDINQKSDLDIQAVFGLEDRRLIFSPFQNYEVLAE